MAIRDWPSDERPREKLLEKGAAALSDAELLAILLRTGTRGHSAVDLARNVLKSFHSLRKLIASDRQRFCAEPGLGLVRYAELQASVEIARRQLSETLRAVHPREIVKLALQRNSAAVIIAHNHPSGVAEPSQADEFITQRVKEALALVDIRLLDHIIVGDGACVSLAERGLL
jgi:DNA repair protein RadC